MIKTHYVHALTSTGAVETFTIPAKSGEDAKSEVRFLYAMRGETVTVYLGL